MRKLNNRDYALIGVFALVFLAFIIRLGYFQIVKADDYANAGKSVSSRSIAVKSTRGEILDRNGYPLVTNRQGNAVVFDLSNKFPTYEEQTERNRIILHLINLFEKADEEWVDNLPIEVDKNGTVAKAKTMMCCMCFGGVRNYVEELVFDKPFHYFLRNTTTGEIIFMGKVNKLSDCERTKPEGVPSPFGRIYL